MKGDSFDPILDMNAIDGCIADLAAKTDRPQGYPFSKIKIYSVCPEVAYYMPHLQYFPASSLSAMRKLDFKKAGKAFGARVKEMKDNLDGVPEEFIITASRFDAVNEKTKKTTGCRKHLIEVECEDQPERWLAIQFRKAIKQYITEDLSINIVPAIFRETFSSQEIFIKTGKMYKDESPVIARVGILLGNCSERLYQALESFGVSEFSEYPIRLTIPERKHILDRPRNHVIKFEKEIAYFTIMC